MDKLIESLISSGIPAIVIIVGLYFGKNLIEHFFNETIELKKKELEQENKNFQYQLDAKLQEFNIKFSSLHSERADVIKNLYFKLIDLQSAMFNYTRRHHVVYENSDLEEKERMERLNKTLKEFIDYYLPNKIFFSESLSKKIDLLLENYWNTSWDFNFYKGIMNDKQTYTKEEINLNFNKYKELSKKVEKDFPPLINELENDFREILGVKN